MWVIEDYRDAPMVPIALFPSEKLARAFAADACGDNAHIYKVSMRDVSESRLDMIAIDDEEVEARIEDEADRRVSAENAASGSDLDAMLYAMRERPAAANTTGSLADIRAVRRAAGAR
jgi:hypothetical protein